ncbi:arylsulfatase [Halalkalibaculum sp. DA3122]|uniref:arylsulfatase n=1 Tax=unclassified Halalkalibaculum TaxID=2964617 RepID=UPI003754CB50
MTGIKIYSIGLLCGWFWVFSSGLLIGNTYAKDSELDQKPPNIVIILADDMGFSDLGSYGGEIKTPNIDKLANNGLRFTQFYNTSRCWPTRTSMLTGYYYQQVRDSDGNGPSWAKLLPHYLDRAGYRSYHSGKWHIRTASKPVADGGFDHSHWLRDHNRYFYPETHYRDDDLQPPIEPNSDYYTTTDYTDYAIEFLQDHEANYKNNPFFLYLAYTAPHFPLQAPQEDIKQYEGQYMVGWDSIRTERWKRLKKMGISDNPLPQLEPDVTPYYLNTGIFNALGPGEIEHAVPWKNLTEQQKRFQAKKMSIHAAMISRMDHEVGRLVGKLKSMGELENTIIFFLSDNGADATIMIRGEGHDREAAMGSGETFLCLGPGWSSSSNTPFRRHKMWVHEGGIATPLIVHWPDGIKSKGELHNTPGHVIDLVPTILDLAGIENTNFESSKSQKPKLPGKSLIPVFENAQTINRDNIFFNHANHRAVRVDNWKLLSAPGNQWELYNLAIDRGETYNIAKLKPSLVDSMATLWNKLQEKFRKQAKQP